MTDLDYFTFEMNPILAVLVAEHRISIKSVWPVKPVSAKLTFDV
jgi:hypothetical protein